MRKLFGILAALSLATPTLAEPKIERWKTHHAMGCMLVQDCTEGVDEINSAADIKKLFPDMSIDGIEEEMNELITELNRIGVGVFVADDKYFIPMNRGVYHTTGNNFFLNRSYMNIPNTILEVTRHEGWHAAQDCMAGSINNNNIAIIWNDGVVPQGYQLRADIAYGGNPQVVPWEAEALWAGDTEYQTVNALRACKNPGGDMWDVYPPTPMTGEWLIQNGYWSGETK